MNKIQCHIAKVFLREDEAHRGDCIRKGILDLIKKDYPDFNENSYLSTMELNRYRKLYLKQLIDSEVVEHDKLAQEVLEAVSEHTILSENIEVEIEKELTFGEKLADLISDFGGSWLFIGLFFAFILLWVGFNIWVFSTKSFDPYPFILLNLLLSCLAAIQAPIILMSQNRSEDKDRKRGEHDFKVNLKAELEIRLLNEKVDHIIYRQNDKLLEILELQTDYLEDILDRIDKKSPARKKQK